MNWFWTVSLEGRAYYGNGFGCEEGGIVEVLGTCQQYGLSMFARGDETR